MITKEELREDLKRVAEKLGKSPTQDEYTKHGRHGHSTVSRRFGSWAKAKEEAGLEVLNSGRHSGPGITDQEMIRDLKRVGYSIDKSPTAVEYSELGEYSPSTLQKRFGSWNEALEEAGFEPNHTPNEGLTKGKRLGKTSVSVYKPDKKKLEEARDIMEEIHGQEIPLSEVLSRVAELYIEKHSNEIELEQ